MASYDSPVGVHYRCIVSLLFFVTGRRRTPSPRQARRIPRSATPMPNNRNTFAVCCIQCFDFFKAFAMSAGYVCVIGDSKARYHEVRSGIERMSKLRQSLLQRRLQLQQLQKLEALNEKRPGVVQMDNLKALKELETLHNKHMKRQEELDTTLKRCKDEFKEFERQDVKHRQDLKHVKQKIKKMEEKAEKDATKITEITRQSEESTDLIPKLEEDIPKLQKNSWTRIKFWRKFWKAPKKYRLGIMCMNCPDMFLCPLLVA
ncbi:RecF/RecN/SMC [Artemisia annua]|uniref:RecF/RecN/SMC n=1 Tax=Artemisia annua TaxID=35608 RepID=A0A2U1KX47_ARTAN|nr:RecF/RecN/SMC [Artemisia annua]